MSLKEKTVSGVKWQVINKVTQKVLSVATFAVLARILDPKAFGTFAMAFIAIDALQFFKAFGLDTALIHKKETDSDYDVAQSSAFWVIQATGILLCLVAFTAAGPVSHFFNKPGLEPIIRVLGIVFVFANFSKVPQTILTKHMKFNQLAIIEFFGSVLNSVAAIVIALLTQNVWALVIAYLMKQILITVMSWYWSGFRVKRQFSMDAAKKLMHYGRFMMGLSLVWFLTGNINNIVVGKFLGATMLGYFALAGNVANFINTHFTQIISSVLFPAYSKIQHDREAIKRGFLKTVKFVSLVSIPFSVFLIVLAKEFVLTLYGPKWLEIVPLIQLFGILQLIVPIIWCNGPVFLGCGKPAYTFNLTLANLAVRIPLLVWFTIQWGLEGAILSNIVASILFFPINIELVRRLAKFSYREFFEQLYPAILCGAVTAVFVLGIKTTVHLERFDVLSAGFAQFLVLGVIGGLAYLMAYFFVDRPTILEARNLFFTRFAAKKS